MREAGILSERQVGRTRLVRANDETAGRSPARDPHRRHRPGGGLGRGACPHRRDRVSVPLRLHRRADARTCRPGTARHRPGSRPRCTVPRTRRSSPPRSSRRPPGSSTAAADTLDDWITGMASSDVAQHSVSAILDGMRRHRGIRSRWPSTRRRPAGRADDHLHVRPRPLPHLRACTWCARSPAETDSRRRRPTAPERCRPGRGRRGSPCPHCALRRTEGSGDESGGGVAGGVVGAGHRWAYGHPARPGRSQRRAAPVPDDGVLGYSLDDSVAVTIVNPCDAGGLPATQEPSSSRSRRAFRTACPSPSLLK